MEYAQVIEWFRTPAKAARALGITDASIAEWKKAGVPKLRQYQIQVLTKGGLTVDKSVDKVKVPGPLRMRAAPQKGCGPTRAGNFAGKPARSRRGSGYADGDNNSGAKNPREGRGAEATVSPSQRVRERLHKASAMAQADTGKSRPPGYAGQADSMAELGEHGAVGHLQPMAQSLTAKVSIPTPTQPGGAAARLAALEAGPQARRDATRTDDALAPLTPQPKIIAAPLPDRPPLTVRQDWRITEQGIRQGAIRPRGLVRPGDKWRDVIARCEDAARNLPLP